MEKDNSVYLKHIIDSINRIEEYTKDVNKEQFMVKHMIQAAAIREIEIIGEATKMLDKQFKETHNLIPWKSIAGMRDKLIHEYFGVDLEAVWKTIKEDIPYLKKELLKIMKS